MKMDGQKYNDILFPHNVLDVGKTQDVRLAAEYLEIDLYLGLVCFCPPCTAQQTSSVTIWNRISEDNQINPLFVDMLFQTCKRCFDDGVNFSEKRKSVFSI